MKRLRKLDDAPFVPSGEILAPIGVKGEIHSKGPVSAKEGWLLRQNVRPVSATKSILVRYSCAQSTAFSRDLRVIDTFT